MRARSFHCYGFDRWPLGTWPFREVTMGEDVVVEDVADVVQEVVEEAARAVPRAAAEAARAVPAAAAKGGGADLTAVFAILALIAALIVPLVMLLRSQKETLKEEVHAPIADRLRPLPHPVIPTPAADSLLPCPPVRDRSKSRRRSRRSSTRRRRRRSSRSKVGRGRRRRVGSRG